MPWLICLHFSMSWCFSPRISMFFLVVFWSWNLDLVVFWSWNPNVVVYVSPRPRLRYHREKKIMHSNVIMLLKNIVIVQIYANLSA